MNIYRALKAFWQKKDDSEKSKSTRREENQTPDMTPENESPKAATPDGCEQNDLPKPQKRSLEETKAIVSQALSLKETNLQMMRHRAALAEQRRKEEKRAKEVQKSKESPSGLKPSGLNKNSNETDSRQMNILWLSLWFTIRKMGSIVAKGLVRLTR